ncbi:MAG: hypothetical protein IJI44_06210 [Erysipelotrichaceae bacterium]|nr:hypothetical protein [Erysipelotrichaceae bacterium]
MAYKILDMDTYVRREHFKYFRSLSYPYVGTSVDVDVTDLLDYCRKHDCSFYLLFMHAAALAADEAPQFRQRIHGDGIVEYDECPTSHTEPLDNGTYCYCTLHHHMELSDYLTQAKQKQEECRNNGIKEDEEVESMYFVSCLPWLHYTSLIQPVAGGDESNPRITWGKYEKNSEGKYVMPVSVLVHHALVDGIHIATFYEHLKRILVSFTR